MAKTTIIFDVTTGAEQKVKPQTIQMRATTRLSLSTGVVLPGPTSVYLENGTASRTVEASPEDGSWAWEFQEFAPGYVGPITARFVPVSADPVRYVDLVEVVSPPDIGFGPSFTGLAQEGAARAEQAVIYVEALIDGLPQQIGILVPQYVSQALAGSPDLRAAATAAINSAAAGLNLVQSSDPRLPLQLLNDSVVYAVTDLQGRRSWVEVAANGRPTPESLAILAADLGPAIQTKVAAAVANIGVPQSTPESAAAVYSIVDQNNRRSWIEIGADGGPTPHSVSKLIAALNLATVPATQVRATYGDQTPAPAVSGPDIATWGDSLTAGAGGGGVTIASTIQDLLTARGKTQVVRNFGVGGERSYDIAARQGGNPMFAMPAGGVIPASGPVAIDIRTNENVAALTFIKQNNYGLNPATIGGVPGTVTYSESAGEYRFTRTASGSSVAVPYPAMIIPGSASSDRRGDIQILAVGRNNTPYGVTEGDRILQVVAAMVQHLSAAVPRFLVGSVLNGSGESPSTDNYKGIAAINKRLRDTYGSRFVDHRRFLIQYGLAIRGITPTTQDLADIAADIVPSSLRSDTIHLNADGYAACGIYFYSRLTELKWV